VKETIARVANSPLFDIPEESATNMFNTELTIVHQKLTAIEAEARELAVTGQAIAADVHTSGFQGLVNSPAGADTFRSAPASAADRLAAANHDLRAINAEVPQHLAEVERTIAAGKIAGGGGGGGGIRDEMAVGGEIAEDAGVAGRGARFLRGVKFLGDVGLGVVVIRRSFLAGYHLREGHGWEALKQVPLLAEDLTPPDPLDLMRSQWKQAAERAWATSHQRAVPYRPLLDKFLEVGNRQWPGK
jgi:hypothetical protein